MNPTTDCQICGKTYRHLGAHVAQAHHITARQYKLEHGLDLSLGLIAEDVAGKLSAAAIAHDMGAQLIRVGESTRLKPGHGRRRTISKQTRAVLVERLRQFQEKHPNFNGRREYLARRKRDRELMTG